MIETICGVQFSKCDESLSCTIHEFVDSLSVSIPDDYRSFLSRTNGGPPTPSGIWLKDELATRAANKEIAAVMKEQEAILNEDAQSQFSAQASLYEHSVFPDVIRSFIPVFNPTLGGLEISSIAKMPGLHDRHFISSLVPIAEISSLLVVMSCCQETYGKIYYGLEGYAYLLGAIEDISDDDVEEFCEELVEIAPSFTELLERLVEPVLSISRDCGLDEATIRKFGFTDYRISFV